MLGGEDHGLHVAQRDAILGADVEHEFLQFVGDHHHIAAEGVDQFAGSVGIDLYRYAAAGTKICNPADGFAFFDARQLDDAAVLAHGLADALVAFLVLHLHAADVGGNADVVGDEYQQRIGIRILAVIFDGGKLFFVRAAAIKTLHAAHEENLEGCHQRRGAGTVENFGEIDLSQIEFKQAEVPHVSGNQMFEDRVTETLAEEGFVAHEDVKKWHCRPRVPSAAKAGLDFAALTARLKPRPFKTKSKSEFFPQAVKSCPDTDLATSCLDTDPKCLDTDPKCFKVQLRVWLATLHS